MFAIGLFLSVLACWVENHRRKGERVPVIMFNVGVILMAVSILIKLWEVMP